MRRRQISSLDCVLDPLRECDVPAPDEGRLRRPAGSEESERVGGHREAGRLHEGQNDGQQGGKEAANQNWRPVTSQLKSNLLHLVFFSAFSC